MPLALNRMLRSLSPALISGILIALNGFRAMTGRSAGIAMDFYMIMTKCILEFSAQRHGKSHIVQLLHTWFEPVHPIKHLGTIHHPIFDALRLLLGCHR